MIFAMDSNTKDVLLITIPLVLTVMTSYVAVLMARVNAKVDKVAVDVNGHSKLLNDAIEAKARAEGKEQERTEQRGREHERAAGVASVVGGIAAAAVTNETLPENPVPIKVVGDVSMKKG